MRLNIIKSHVHSPLGNGHKGTGTTRSSIYISRGTFQSACAPRLAPLYDTCPATGFPDSTLRRHTPRDRWTGRKLKLCFFCPFPPLFRTQTRKQDFLRTELHISIVNSKRTLSNATPLRKNTIQFRWQCLAGRRRGKPADVPPLRIRFQSSII